MKPTQFKEQNLIFKAADGMNDSVDLPVHKGRQPMPEPETLPVHKGFTQERYPVIISAWKLSKSELEQVKQTGIIYVSVFTHKLPPLFLSVESPF